MLSKQSKYAIRGVLFLAKNTGKNQKLGSKEVSEKTDIPAPFLAKIFQRLAKEGLIKSTKGPKGGFYMTEKESGNSLLDIITCIDGMESFTSCFLGLPNCSDDNPCVVHRVAALRRDDMLRELGNRRIRDLAEESNIGISRIS